jgi:carbonic anhydrase
MISAFEALKRLREGNRRFADNVRESDVLPSHRRAELTSGQAPFAIILGCSDSRVPAEIVFDQGLGDLFVIRVAGNIVAPSQVGSVEFAAERFSTRLVVVLGHSQCGAITATLDELQRPSASQSRNLHAIVDRVRPSVEALLETDLRHDRDALVAKAVRLNIRAAANHLRHGSQVLEQLIRDDGLMVVGAEYSLETGVVAFFDGVPPADIAAEPLDAASSVALITALNAELSAMYQEPGTTHFRLDRDEVASGRGAFLVARREGVPVGCGAIRGIDASSGELKRMYVAPEVRGLGIGRLLLQALEHEARRLGFNRIMLETGVRQDAAIGLYREMGYTDVPAWGEYASSPVAICLGKTL